MVPQNQLEAHRTDFIKQFSSLSDAQRAYEFAQRLLDRAKYTPYDELYLELQEIRDSLKRTDTDLAKQVLDHFNKVCDTHYRNTDLIQKIIKQLPKVSFDQFASIIEHKAETWRDDPKMCQYLRPATLFGSKQKFITYLEDATNYWINKSKQ